MSSTEKPETDLEANLDEAAAHALAAASSTKADSKPPVALDIATPSSEADLEADLAADSEANTPVLDITVTKPNLLRLGIKGRVIMWVLLTIAGTLCGVASFAAAELSGLTIGWAILAAIGGTAISSVALGLITLMAFRASVEWKLSN